MIWQTVIDKTSGEVLRAGYCDFENDGAFNSENEQIITGKYNLDSNYEYTYDTQTEEFTKGVLKYSPNSEKYLRIYNYINQNTEKIPNKYIVPKDINYSILPLLKDVQMADGDITEIIYYGGHSGSAFTIPVVKETYVYTYENNLPTERTLTIEWYCENDSLSADTKTKVKKYNMRQGMKAIKQKRSNIVDSTKINLVGYLIMTGEAATPTAAQEISKLFLRELGGNVSLYIEGDRQPLIDQIGAEEDTWLDNQVTEAGNQTIRNLLINEIEYTI